MKKICYTFAIICCILSLQAQVQFGGVVVFSDFEGLNGDLSNNAYPTISENVYSFSVLGTSADEYKNFTSRTGLVFNHYEKNATNASSSVINELNMRTVGFISGTGYEIINNKWFTFGPSLDLLIVQNRMKLISNLPLGLSFNNILSNDVQTEEFTNVRFMFDGSLHAVLKFGKGEGKSTYGIGITGGYRWDPFDPKWRYNKSSVKIEIPGSEQSGFFVGLILSIKGSKLTPPKPNIKKERS